MVSSSSDAPIAQPQTAPARRALPATRPGTQRPQRYAVVLHDDPISSFEFVITALQEVFSYSLQKAYILTLKAHRDGRATVWVGLLEPAEFKADRIVSLGPDPIAMSKTARPLRVTVEPIGDDDASDDDDEI